LIKLKEGGRKKKGIRGIRWGIFGTDVFNLVIEKLKE
jgi:hypothetical protein